MKKQLIILFTACVLVSCKNEQPVNLVINPSEYDSYLNSDQSPTMDEALAVKDFWSKRLRPDSSGVGDLGPLAGGYEALFASTGKVSNLYSAEALYKKGIAISANGKDGFERGLAHNFISQHRFKEAYNVLKKSLEGSSNKKQTKQMLFDAAMEIGAYEEAYGYLNEIKNLSDYNYLIRLSKWSDHKGDLDSAIKFMEMAKDIADSRDSKPLKIWTYSNLADYYGHAGRIDESYALNLATLELQPDNAYVKKSLSWIAYAADKNTEEAHRILDSVMVSHHVPDYLLSKAELYEYEGNNSLAENFKSKFIAEILEGNYGAMYNAYLIELYADRDPKKALDLALAELDNRKTPQTYHLLALAHLKNGAPQVALEQIDMHVANKTSEPMALYHSALVYKANGLNEKVQPIKEELKEASFELGPVLMREIDKL